MVWLNIPGGSEGKASACNVRNPYLIPELGRSPGEGNGNPLQSSCLETPMDGRAWGHKELDMTERLHFLYFSTLQTKSVDCCCSGLFKM